MEKNPFKWLGGGKSPKEHDDQVFRDYADEMYGRIKETDAKKAADEAAFAKGQQDARMMTLRKFSPDAITVLLQLGDEHTDEMEFDERIEAYNAAEPGEAAGEVAEHFSVPVAHGRTVDVTLYQNGHVELSGSPPTLH